MEKPKQGVLITASVAIITVLKKNPDSNKYIIESIDDHTLFFDGEKKHMETVRSVIAKFQEEQDR